MAFEKLAGRRNRTENVSVALYVGRKTDTTKQVTIGLAPRITKELGWRENERIDFLWGTGEDTGYLRLVQREDGYFPDKSRVTIATYMTAVVPKTTSSVRVPIVECEYEIEGKSITITLPESFYEA